MKKSDDSVVLQARLATAEPVSSGMSLTDRLRDLTDAKNSGLLAEQEYQNAKKNVLAEYTGSGGGAITTQPAPKVQQAAPVRTSVITNPPAHGNSNDWAGKILPDDIAGSYCCLCCFPPFGIGWTKIMADGPDRIHQKGCCLCGFNAFLPCVGGETRTRIPNTNSFRNDKDHRNVTNFTSNSFAHNGCSCLCKVSPPASFFDKRFQHIPAADIAGNWCCACWFPGLGCSIFSKAAINDDELLHNGVCCWNGIPACGGEKRIRIKGTNGFYKSDDPNNIDWYFSKSFVGNGSSCSCKC